MTIFENTFKNKDELQSKDSGEDSEVDHIVPFSKGGKTEYANAQLVLRYFNRAKKNNTKYNVGNN